VTQSTLDAAGDYNRRADPVSLGHSMQGSIDSFSRMSIMTGTVRSRTALYRVVVPGMYLVLQLHVQTEMRIEVR
jgi:hypothetical protein